MKNDACGFTLIEVIAILLIVGILGSVAASRLINIQSVNSVVEADTIRNRIRFVQSMAMKSSSFGSTSGEKCRGIKCHQNFYWFFIGNDSEDAGNQLKFPGEQDVKIALSGVTVTPFTIFFDVYGIPYTAFTDETTNTRLMNPLQITVGSKTMTLLPETGFIQ
ncbi:pilus assembly FimT family protein [Desulfobacula phenolica]|nr:type II secretion system protein [Desulfobacula phenolica]